MRAKGTTEIRLSSGRSLAGVYLEQSRGARDYKWKLFAILLLCLLPLYPLYAQSPETPKISKKTKKSETLKPPPKKNLQSLSFPEIVQQYSFVGDFVPKESERQISEEFFWRYPFVLPKVTFPIEYDFGSGTDEMPATPGQERPIEHLNWGRVLFMNKNYEDARKTWLSSRARYGKDYSFHRRADYFIATAFLNIAKDLKEKANGNWYSDEVKINFSNSATFFSWAFLRKADVPDPLLERLTPKGLYNLSAIYYQYDRFSASHAAAQSGLEFLGKTGRSDYRPKLRRLVAESWIRDQDYLRATQELDTLIRQDINVEEAAQAFARVGDIYFDLNNYELAEDAYSYSEATFKNMEKIKPQTAILRGESLFWLGKFSEAQKAFWFGLNASTSQRTVEPLSPTFAAWANLRMGDAFLARYRKMANQTGEKANAQRTKLLEQASLAYFRTHHQFPNSEAAKIAEIRRACLELPLYEGNNITHARKLLDDSKHKEIPLEAIELAWACEVSSYALKERTAEMVERVKKFLERYPDSIFLRDFIEPVREERLTHFDAYLNNNQYYEATQFYETNHERVFKELTHEQKQKLFAAYVKIFQSEKAKQFWEDFKPSINSLEDELLASVFIGELPTEELTPETEEFAKQIADKLIAENWEANLSNDSIKFYFHRILSSNTAKYHLPWMFKYTSLLTKDAKSKDPLCQMLYPILSKWIVTSNDSNAIAIQAIQQVIEANLPALFVEQRECAVSYINLEERASTDKVAFAKKWLTRMHWPKIKPVISMLWTVSEFLANAHEDESAEKIWKYLKDEIPSTFPESHYATIRLDHTHTEVEQLWH